MKTIITIEKEISPILTKATELVIDSSDDLKRSAEMLTQCNRHLDDLTDQKEKLTKPLNQALKEVRARYKPVEEVIGKTIEVLRSEQSRFQTSLVATIKEQEKVIADQMASGELDFCTAVDKLGEVDFIEKIDNLSFMSKDTFEVMDVTMLPHEYILPNETKIREVMKEGVELPGVRYFTIQISKNNR